MTTESPPAAASRAAAREASQPRASSTASIFRVRETPDALFAIATLRRQPGRSARNSTATIFASKQGRSFLFRHELARDYAGQRETDVHRLVLRVGGRDAHLTA